MNTLMLAASAVSQKDGETIGVVVLIIIFGAVLFLTGKDRD